MDAGNASMLPLILVNVACAVLALGTGVFVGWWCFGAKPAKPLAENEGNEAEQALEKRLAAERALMATNRLQDLALGVASDVGSHNKVVQAITSNLKAAEQADSDAQKAEVSAALTQLVSANEDLQKRLEKAEEQIKTQALEIEAHESEARTDSLTQLANRRAFDDELNRRFAEWRRKATTFSLLILDVDHFKKFNDTHGHQAGDEVLRKVARSLSQICREMDIPCRYGGEEFAIILPATAARDACGLVERLRKGIETLQITFEGKLLSVTASFGLAQVTNEDDEHRLLKRADEALYAAKDAGRNTSYLHDNKQCVPINGHSKVAKPTAAGAAEEKVVTRVFDGLANRTRFSEELRRRVAGSQRSGEKLSVLAIELPGYGDLRSEYGDGVGRLTLDSVAQFLLASLREMDLLGRLDDGQFIIMLPTSDQETAKTVGNRAAKALAKCAVPLGDAELKLDVKTSIAELSDGESAAQLLARAEESLRSSAAAEAPALA